VRRQALQCVLDSIFNNGAKGRYQGNVRLSEIWLSLAILVSLASSCPSASKADDAARDFGPRATRVVPTTSHQRQAAPVLHLTHTFRASREQVFNLWTDAEAVKRWFAYKAPLEWSPAPTVDARTGGRYRIRAIGPGGDSEVYDFSGTYRTVRPPSKLTFTWEWEVLGDLGPGHTLITVELLSKNGNTRMKLIQRKLPNSRSLEASRKGWTRCFEGMEEVLRAETPGNLL